MKNKKTILLAILLILAVANIRVFLNACTLYQMTHGSCMQKAMNICDSQCASHGGCNGVWCYMGGCVEGVCEAEYESYCNDGYYGPLHWCWQNTGDCPNK
jgi:hypothetical protein